MIIINLIEYIGKILNINSSKVRNFKIIYVYYLNTFSLFFSIATIVIFLRRPNNKLKFISVSCAIYLLSYINYKVFTKNLFKTNMFIK